MATALAVADHGLSDAIHSAGSNGNTGGDGGDNSRSRRSLVKKRTKTGCMTCRRRRIKCDEGRPTCNNCLKSKKHCDGYSQRVVFKESLGAYQYPGDTGLYPQAYVDYHHPPHPITSVRPIHGQLAVLAPKPSTLSQYPHHPPYGYDYQPRPNQIVPTSIPYDPAQGDYYSQHASQPDTLGPSTVPSVSFGTSSLFHAGRLPHNNSNQSLPYDAVIRVGSANRQAIELARSQAHGALEIGDDSSDVDEEASLMESDDNDDSPLVVWSEFCGYENTNSFFNILSEYTTIPRSTPGIGNIAVRKCLWNFIMVTGPSISLYEREPFDPKQRAQEVTQGSRRGESNRLWGLNFPMLAIRHPGLLHAMLAISSLQMAKLTGQPSYTAIKHYHLAMRRVAKNLGPLRRKHPATLAAALLLAYFEVWASDHQKWCKHLLGARQLFASIELYAMSRKCLRLKMLNARRFASQPAGLRDTGPLPEDPSMLDFGLISAICGTSVHKSHYNLGTEDVFGYIADQVSDKDVEDYDNLRDLFWWYCKMDVYQSMLGGSKLLMNYAHWTQCPPRAPVGMMDTIYGTYDHLILLLGRLATFASNDLPRKRAASRAKCASAAGSSPPPFHGMIPVGSTVQVPMGFSPPREASPPSECSEESDPELGYQRAMAQWESIEATFRMFKERIEHVFRPLSAEFSDRRDRPFGVAVQYQTYSIAGIWMNYYMGLIHLHRSHPSMPPAAMQSAGLAAARTMEYATMIGRIAVGIVGDLSAVVEISTVMGAALIESTFCLFWAAVQYQGDDQRHWVVQRMHDITRLTGWQTAKQIAEGCESAWTKAAQMGRGPPYISRFPSQTFQSVWQSPRRLDKWIQEVPDDERVITLDQGPHFALGLLAAESDDKIIELYRGRVSG